MEHKDRVSRRDFLQRISLLGAVGLGGGTLLAACGGGNSGDMSSTDQMSQDAGEGGDEMASADAGHECDDLSGLSEADRTAAEQSRKTLEYTSTSPNEDKHCNNCQFFQAPAEGATCGGCQVIKGPIAPNGFCNSWAAKTT